ncbi:hypothetical protein BN940_04726 [Castellaniella defragrans 65Phen]|uniref:Uncharacterized protein n=1 Tax=Castellaniella defragrans (strain DSM 12143 / CCUG 39792 / 65Phen) TaxID=1437824 RepID=W8X8P1_CASD6|nr:hypothetical protein BN940_04726 [Castellaniella defragrans 65Phen]
MRRRREGRRVGLQAARTLAGWPGPQSFLRGPRPLCYKRIHG